MRILLVDIDSCRADHLECNGHPRSTTPYIDRVAASGVTFTRCHQSNSPCAPARAAIFSGRSGFRTGVVAHHGKGERFRYEEIYRGHWRDLERPMLPLWLWRHGIRTVSFSSFPDRHNAWWFTPGWQEMHTFTRRRGQETADEVNAAFLPWLRREGREDNWFVHLHYWDPHSPYRVPEEWVNRFRNAPPPDWPDQQTIDRQQSFSGPRSAVDLYAGYEGLAGGGYARPASFMPDAIRTVEDVKMLIDGYDASIAYTDFHLGQVFDVLDTFGVLDETAVIVTADHGDSFGEHGQYMDHGIANAAVHTVPLVVRWPGVTDVRRDGEERTGPRRCEAMIYGMDLAPTLCELLGFPVPGAWEGRSFAGALRDEEFTGWPWQVWDHGTYTFTRAVRRGDWLLIRTLHPGLYPYPLVMLHDLRADPHQATNLADERPDVVGELMALLDEWRQEQIAKTGAPDPLEQMVAEGPFLYYTPEQMIQRLEQTNRAALIPELTARINQYRPGRLGE